ncbi:MAG: alpha/beta fold hydrolase [Flavobacteriales bacterium]|nr:alpha/beta fold hydrolase [Flavobacteriales bacterium]MBK7941967.1 alpha/beta fold hydrolase [Flavobacteriales bacterium]MBK8947768.1 alpha/beta fold hydrolase [Flavobacteriales bacterium]MBK9700511.1 alpha/beta fold hydrolase [Flavobacteriales bacterium]
MRPTLLLVHGFPQDATLWEGTAAALHERADVITPDLRGFGSDAREVPSVLSMDVLAEDLADLLDQRGVHRAVIGGLSMGGYVALAFAERWPQRVQALVLCNTRSTADTVEARQARLGTAETALTKGTAVIARGMMPKLLSRTTRRAQPGLAARVEAMMARQRPVAVAAAAMGMAARPDRTAVLQGLRVPVLIITGEEDDLMPLPTSQAMQEAATDARLRVIPGVGHLSNLERPDAFHRAVRDFLNELSRST